MVIFCNSFKTGGRKNSWEHTSQNNGALQLKSSGREHFLYWIFQLSIKTQSSTHKNMKGISEHDYFHCLVSPRMKTNLQDVIIGDDRENDNDKRSGETSENMIFQYGKLPGRVLEHLRAYKSS